MTEIYYWQDDEVAEAVLEKFDELGIEYEAQLLDHEIPNARPYANYKGETYWDLEQLLRALEAEKN